MLIVAILHLFVQVSDPEVQNHEKLLVLLILGISFIAFMSFIFIIKSRNAIKSQLGIIESQNNEIESKNAELEYINESLKDLNTEKNSIINVVAHDLKTPLGNIEGLANLIALEKDKLSDDQLKYLNMIIDTSQVGRNLIDDVLDVHKLESEIDSMELHEQDVMDPINEVIKQHQIMAKEKSVEIELSGSTKMEPVKTDKQYLKLIISNILSNAIKFSPKGATVHFLIQEKERSWSFSIADEGIGMNERTMQRLMSPHSSVEGYTGEGDKVSGSGFTLTRKLIEKMNGKLRMKSEMNKGAMITVEFLK